MNGKWDTMTSHSDDVRSQQNEWETPQTLYDHLEISGGEFTWDLAASDNNHKAPYWFTVDNDSLVQDWSALHGRLFCNPPYGRDIKRWIEKAADMTDFSHNFDEIVMVIPARTDTSYWHEYIFDNPRASVDFLRGRLKFERDGLSGQPAPFASAVVTFR